MTKHGVLAVALAFGTVASAHEESAAGLPRPLVEVSFDQQLGASLPLDLAFRDHSGRPVTLEGYFAPGRPVVLAQVYFDCTMLCSQVLAGISTSLRALSLKPGRDFELVVISFDPSETPEMAAEKRDAFLDHYGDPEAAAGWHHLVGAQAAIDRLTEATGFRYTRDEEAGEWAHASGIIVATPEGVLSRYLYGIEYAPRDLKLALVEASDGAVGSPVDQLLLYCFHYDPTTGRYGAAIMNLIRAAGLLTVAALAIFVFRNREPMREKSHA